MRRAAARATSVTRRSSAPQGGADREALHDRCVGREGLACVASSPTPSACTSYADARAGHLVRGAARRVARDARLRARRTGRADATTSTIRRRPRRRTGSRARTPVKHTGVWLPPITMTAPTKVFAPACASASSPRCATRASGAPRPHVPRRGDREHDGRVRHQLARCSRRTSP